MMQETLKRRPLKKRHTKPCKFYQTMSCPLSADVCDFAHVLVDPPSALRAGDACRYYQAGFCVNGSWCKYAHPIEVSPTLSESMSGLGASDSNVRRMNIQRSASDSIKTPVSANAIERLPSPVVLSMHMPTDKVHSSPPEFNCLSISPQRVPQLMKMKSFASLPNATVPQSPVYPNGAEGIILVTEDPHMSEHSHSHQSRVYIADSTPPMHVSPYHSHQHHPQLSIGSVDTRYSLPSPVYILEPKFYPVRPPLRKHRSRGMSKKKLEKYKTKPCKFFVANGHCPNGNSCTFIHCNGTDVLESDDATKDGFDAEGSGSSCESPSESRKMFPEVGNEKSKAVVWRVIGGGVMIGAPTASENVFAGTEQPDTCSTSSDDNTYSASPQHVTEPPLEDDVSELRVSKRGRPRANSIPSKSSSRHLSVESLFAAESPAIL
ncbi:hypothetical protein AX17_005307 [Amanita inopinata Kibby_2008]|nr:hypothetical protein AX17_005307 [Amanita inopinata Kibby_2008]